VDPPVWERVVILVKPVAVEGAVVLLFRNANTNATSSASQPLGKEIVAPVADALPTLLTAAFAMPCMTSSKIRLIKSRAAPKRQLLWCDWLLGAVPFWVKGIVHVVWSAVWPTISAK